MVAKALGTTLYILGALAVFGLDIVASAWLAENHGLGWVIASWVLVIPLLVIPFLAGIGLFYAIALGVTFGGAALRGWSEDRY